jgi:hypothetical protein
MRGRGASFRQPLLRFPEPEGGALGAAGGAGGLIGAGAAGRVCICDVPGLWPPFTT